MTTPISRPADRYGDRNRGRWLLVVAVALAVVAVVAAVVFIARAADAQIRASVLAWETPPGDTMIATVEVVRRPDQMVTCDLIARDLRQIIVGQTELVVPATPERRVVLTAEIPLQGDAVVAAVQGCTPAKGR
jgi:hypothetical protein